VAIAAGAAFSILAELLNKHGSPLRRAVILSSMGLVLVGGSFYLERLFLFELSPIELYCQVYFNNPFTETPEIAKYIKQNSSPDDTVAVIGSEPEIYFYSGRRAATSYIYTYPLMEPQPYALQMQKEMIGQIEADRPKFIVFVNVNFSWLVGPNSELYIFKWCDDYINRYYTLAGVADIVDPYQTIFLWDGRAANYNVKSQLWLKVFRRKQ
jgi:hypothetical protein